MPFIRLLSDVLCCWKLAKRSCDLITFGKITCSFLSRHSFSSRLFGYKKPIAHALFLVARAESAIVAKGKVIFRIPVVFSVCQLLWSVIRLLGPRCVGPAQNSWAQAVDCPGVFPDAANCLMILFSVVHLFRKVLSKELNFHTTDNDLPLNNRSQNTISVHIGHRFQTPHTPTCR
jgi:hypothetical protein